MRNRLCCNRAQPTPAISSAVALLLLAGVVASASPALAGDAPGWMHALVNAPLPEHDEKTNAVLLYSETNVTVVSTDKIKTQVREAYKILRPDGRGYGVARVYFRSPGEKVTSMHGWCIPANGKDYEVKDKEAVELSIQGVAGSELIDDLREKRLPIPASDPGNIVGYEYEKEEQPLVLQDSWWFQEAAPVREAHYSLQLPPGWEYRARWINFPEVKPSQAGNNGWQWVVNNVKELRPEDEMPPIQGVAGQMIVSFYPAGGPSPNTGFSNWKEMGTWYWKLETGRADASPEIKQQARALTAGSTNPVDKMRALARFVQHDIRYVAIELGIGGWQPHPAAEVFSHHYGDCKDKAILMQSLLREAGFEAFQVAINTERGSITPETPAYRGFDHEITAIRLPDGVNDSSLIAVLPHPRLGRLLFFDPTDEVTPFGQLAGGLQSNWGLLVTSEGGELVELPKQPPEMNSIQRTAMLTLDASGTLKGAVKEVRLGDRAWAQRWALKTVARDIDRIKPIEEILANSISNFRITKATLVNQQQTDLPFGYEYSFEAQNYAKNAGGMLLVRPRILGTKSSPLLETKEPRRFPIEFEGPVKDTDQFEITIPAGYEVDDLPPPVDVDFGYANYHSKTEAAGNVIRYSRTFEVKELSVPLNKADELKKFYRIIATDERNTAVLKQSAK